VAGVAHVFANFGSDHPASVEAGIARAVEEARAENRRSVIDARLARVPSPHGARCAIS
jgi:hypothetical protein